jgi:TRAP-type C4-dicarboxylate transport system substrate-binding protein
VRDDLVDLSYVTASYTPARFLLTKLGELPGGGATATINSVAYSRVHYKYFAPANEYKGVHLLGVFTHGPGQIYNSKHEVASLADLKGLKIRTGGGIAADMGKAMGATLIFKPAPLAYELLKEGVADGVFFPLESPASFHLEKLIHYATLFHGGFYSSTFGFFMNPGKWDALPQRDKDALNKVSGEYVARFAGHMWDAADKVGLAAIKKANVKITHASPAFEAEVKALAKSVIEDWYKDAARRNVDGPKAFAMYHAEIDKLEARMKK